VSPASTFERAGKVRDLYRLDDDRLLLVASDRISAFDVVLPTPIPDKGRVLTGLSRFWFGETASIVHNHLVGTDPDSIGTAGGVGPEADGLGPEKDDLRGRMMVCRRAAVLPFECIVRGYLAGTGWKDYRATGRVCGVGLPAGLRESDRLPEPVFTPSTKAELGVHDENVAFDAVVAEIGGELAEEVRAASLALYRRGSAIAERAGILLADTKFEFGVEPGSGDLLLIDEVLTPDSSRFWDAAAYAPGGPQPSYDKQFVRDWLEGQGWDKTAPGPALPPELVAGTRARYVTAFERITRASFERYLREDVIGP
jgi:phosphoribosylaminoimidazole-succinocarboxamide synthase